MKLSTMSMALVGLANLGAAYAKAGKWFDRFVVIVLENTNKATALGNSYYAGLTEIGMLLDGYQATTHPSQPNYITMITSTIAAGVFDDADHNSTQNSLVDLFDANGVTWKAYMEGYSQLPNGGCNTVSANKTTHYVRKHNPFMSFLNIQTNLTRCKNIVSGEQFSADIAKGAQAPNYMYYVPNLLNDAHDTNVSYAVTDLKKIVDTMLGNSEFMKNTLVVITFDENDIYTPQYYGTQNDVYTVLLGNDTLKCYNCVDQMFYNHFSQVVTVEQNWNLGNIPNPDGDGAQWDSWMLPFRMLRSKKDANGLCAYNPC